MFKDTQYNKMNEFLKFLFILGENGRETKFNWMQIIASVYIVQA